MIRLFLTLCVALSSPVNVYGQAPFVNASPSGFQFFRPALISETALSPVAVFVAHAIGQSAFAVRQILRPERWAWAGDAAVKTAVWDYQPGGPHRDLEPLRMDASNPGSDAVNDPDTPESRANGLLAELRWARRWAVTSRGGLPRHNRTLLARISKAIETRGAGSRLAQGIARQLLRTFNGAALGDEVTWVALGGLLSRESAQLRAQMALTEPQITKVLQQMSADQVEDLFQFLQTLNPNNARTILTAAIVKDQPEETAYRLRRQYQNVYWAVSEVYPAIAGSVAIRAFNRLDPFSAMRRYIQNYEAVLQLVSRTHPHLAHRVASRAFSFERPLPWARRYLRNIQPSGRSRLESVLIPLAISAGLSAARDVSAMPGGEMLHAALVPFFLIVVSRTAGSPLSGSLPVTRGLLALARAA